VPRNLPEVLFEAGEQNVGTPGTQMKLGVIVRNQSVRQHWWLAKNHRADKIVQEIR